MCLKIGRLAKGGHYIQLRGAHTLGRHVPAGHSSLVVPGDNKQHTKFIMTRLSKNKVHVISVYGT